MITGGKGEIGSTTQADLVRRRAERSHLAGATSRPVGVAARSRWAGLAAFMLYYTCCASRIDCSILLQLEQF